MFDLNEDLACAVREQLVNLGFGSWSAECAQIRTLRDTDLAEVLVLLLDAVPFKGENVQLSEDGDAI